MRQAASYAGGQFLCRVRRAAFALIACLRPVTVFRPNRVDGYHRPKAEVRGAVSSSDKLRDHSLPSPAMNGDHVDPVELILGEGGIVHIHSVRAPCGLRSLWRASVSAALLFLGITGCAPMPYADPDNKTDQVPLTIDYTGTRVHPQASIFLEPKTCSAPRYIAMDDTATRTIYVPANQPSTLFVGGARLAGALGVVSCQRFAMTAIFDGGARYRLTHHTGDKQCTLRLTRVEDGVARDVSSSMKLRQERNPAAPSPREGPYCVDQY